MYFHKLDYSYSYMYVSFQLLIHLSLSYTPVSCNQCAKCSESQDYEPKCSHLPVVALVLMFLQEPNTLVPFILLWEKQYQGQSPQH